MVRLGAGLWLFGLSWERKATRRYYYLFMISIVVLFSLPSIVANHLVTTPTDTDPLDDAFRLGQGLFPKLGSPGRLVGPTPAAPAWH
jgi:hypothetical protein